jgi:hypothetical protein
MSQGQCMTPRDSVLACVALYNPSEWSVPSSIINIATIQKLPIVRLDM